MSAMEPSKSPFNRQGLYALIWEKPVVRVAKRFGISDVALRKICKKHDVPLPPLGYWAKLAHGKKVTQPPLPPRRDDILDRVYLVEKPIVEEPTAVTEARARAQEREVGAAAKITIPAQRPEKLHFTALATERTLKKAKPDDEGFIASSGPGLVTVRIGPQTIERAVILLDTFLKALIARGFKVSDDEKGVVISVDGEVFWMTIYESRDRRTHQPTKEELKEQADRERWRAQYPGMYSANSKAYRSWDYFPSGRLSFELASEWREHWHPLLAGRWYGRANKPVEECLNDAVVALITTAATIKHNRALAEDAARRAAEAAELRRQEAARRMRAGKRREYLAKKAAEHQRYLQLSTLLRQFEGAAEPGGQSGLDRITRELRCEVDALRQSFDRAEIDAEVAKLGLYGDDD